MASIPIHLQDLAIRPTINLHNLKGTTAHGIRNTSQASRQRIVQPQKPWPTLAPLIDNVVRWRHWLLVV